MRDTNDPEYMKLFLAAHDGDVEKVKKLVNKENVNNLFFHPDDGFKTALHCASERGRYEVVKALLLMEGAIVDYRDDEKMTPLLRAAVMYKPSKACRVMVAGSCHYVSTKA